MSSLFTNEYDAVTFGNHEFDANNNGLENMLEKALTHQKLVPIVATNVYLKEKKGNLVKYFNNDSRLIKKTLVKSYRSQGKEFKVGFIGLLGPDGCMASKGTRGNVAFYGYEDKNYKARWDELKENNHSFCSRIKE